MEVNVIRHLEASAAALVMLPSRAPLCTWNTKSARQLQQVGQGRDAGSCCTHEVTLSIRAYKAPTFWPMYPRAALFVDLPTSHSARKLDSLKPT
eukprot:scaffold292377_cov21-Tisochrysis_lutea.AAC.1